MTTIYETTLRRCIEMQTAADAEYDRARQWLAKGKTPQAIAAQESAAHYAYQASIRLFQLI